jgi:hypothetical protein
MWISTEQNGTQTRQNITLQAKSLNIEIRILISNTNGTSSRPSMETLKYLVYWGLNF